eukprot:TRINITY_DN43008_c0_g1_i1.p1 TRINITY_DN43008_c0_g1~~TRINITY_DN43008_c0_g1_i1.p1  ORF type:complete len:227 (-),score=44.12 TRINITY_DN43008_c0_g1_i1:74-652(-)
MTRATRRSATTAGATVGAAAAAAAAAAPVYVHVRGGILQDLQERLKDGRPINAEQIQALSALDDAADDEMLVPIDVRERLHRSADALRSAQQDPRINAKSYVNAAALFASHTEGLSGVQRPKPMTAREWRGDACEDDADAEEGEEESEDPDEEADEDNEGAREDDDKEVDDGEDEIGHAEVDESPAKKHRAA